MDLQLFLPFPPTVNNYYVKTQRGVFISQKGRKFRDDAHQRIYEQLGDHTIGNRRVLIEVILYPPDKRTRDIGNYDKGLLDAITTSGLWDDDSQVDQQFFYRGEIVKGGLTRIHITDAGPILPLGYEFPQD